VAPVIQRFQAAKAVWPWGPDGDDAQRERWLYPGHMGRPQTQPEPDWAQVHQEWRSRRHVTLQLLWEEYRQVHPDGYRYIPFGKHDRRYRDRVDLVLR
jgi:transposase